MSDDEGVKGWIGTLVDTGAACAKIIEGQQKLIGDLCEQLGYVVTSVENGEWSEQDIQEYAENARAYLLEAKQIDATEILENLRDLEVLRRIL